MVSLIRQELLDTRIHVFLVLAYHLILKVIWMQDVREMPSEFEATHRKYIFLSMLFGNQHVGIHCQQELLTVVTVNNDFIYDCQTENAHYIRCKAKKTPNFHQVILEP